jgi:hypothetical protein
VKTKTTKTEKLIAQRRAASAKLPPGVTIHEGGGKFRIVPAGGVEHMAFIGQQLNEIRSMVAVPPANGAVAHSVEVSKRLDELRFNTKQAIDGVKRTIDIHVTAYEKRLAELEFQFPMLLNRVKELEAKLASKPKRK